MHNINIENFMNNDGERSIFENYYKRICFTKEDVTKLWNVSQRYKIKTLNSKKYDEQLNVARSSIKNKLPEITKEPKEFKFQKTYE